MAQSAVSASSASHPNPSDAKAPAVPQSASVTSGPANVSTTPASTATSASAAKPVPAKPSLQQLTTTMFEKLGVYMDAELLGDFAFAAVCDNCLIVYVAASASDYQLLEKLNLTAAAKVCCCFLLLDADSVKRLFYPVQYKAM